MRSTHKGLIAPVCKHLTLVNDVRNADSRARPRWSASRQLAAICSSIERL